MTDKERMAEMEALLRDAPCAGRSTADNRSWYDRRDAILAPPPDPDAGAREAYGAFTKGMDGMPRFENQNTARWAQVAAWKAECVKAARIEVLQEALNDPRNIVALIAKEETVP